MKIMSTCLHFFNEMYCGFIDKFPQIHFANVLFSKAWKNRISLKDSLTVPPQRASPFFQHFSSIFLFAWVGNTHTQEIDTNVAHVGDEILGFDVINSNHAIFVQIGSTISSKKKEPPFFNIEFFLIIVDRWFHY